MFGFPWAQLLGKPIEALIPERARSAHGDHRERYEVEPTMRSMGTGRDLRGLRADGSEFPVDVSLKPIADGSGVVAVVRDMTAAVQDEARLGYLTAIIDSSHDAIFNQDRDGLITGWNRAAQLLFGYHQDEVSGWRSTRLVAEAHWEVYELMLRRVLAGEVLQHFETEIKRRDGLVVPVSLTLSPIRERSRNVIGASAIARDITEQRMALTTLAESEARLREGEALAHVGGWVLDAGTKTVQWSQELYRIHGVDPADFDGTLAAHLALVHDDDRAPLAATIDAAVDDSEPLEAEYRIVCTDQRVRWLYTRAEPALGPGGAVLGLRGICQDITERRAAADALRHAYERERQAAESLRAADALKDEFLATVSHELRTPLATIAGFSSLIKADHSNPAVADMAERIGRNAQEMLGMVERLLDFSRLQAGKAELAPEVLALDALISGALETGWSSFVDHSLDISIPGGIVVVADREATIRIVGNLVSNAAKFSANHTPIEIFAVIEDGAAVVKVRDHGPGIPPELRDRVFERFFQTPDQPPGKRGAGVGLAIVRRYVELQGGRVWHESPTDGGSAFCFTLPLAQP